MNYNFEKVSPKKSIWANRREPSIIFGRKGQAYTDGFQKAYARVNRKVIHALCPEVIDNDTSFKLSFFHDKASRTIYVRKFIEADGEGHLVKTPKTGSISQVYKLALIVMKDYNEPTTFPLVEYKDGFIFQY